VTLCRLGAGATVTLLLAFAGAAIKPTTADGDLRPAQPPAVLPVPLAAAPVTPTATVAPTAPNR